MLDHSDRAKVLGLFSWTVSISYDMTTGMPKVSGFFFSFFRKDVIVI